MLKKLEEFLRSIAFNIKRPKELELNRRGFIASTLGLMGLFFVGSTPLLALSKRLEHESDEKEFLIVKEGEVAVGDSYPFSYPDDNDPALLIRISEEEYRAYNIKCTHLMCPVYWEKTTHKLTCPCHNGFFNVEDGSVLAGPPPRPLPSIKLEFKKGGIYATGIAQAQH